ncbi:hypothetical protein A5768_26425 [Mycolicibacterium fortuitum]|uniref:hypothetical protein n=1 Tax=Mycolicibacterium fortuitum TaxID=1766 RepID=UPI0007E96B88|nr:hypothetical protein [Mycolicibacterium fortuitum]OBG21639.1 hypothetical protein A5768_26425 [Mycolicibacterium fortuitum]
MTQTRTLRFHARYGPAALFEKAREQLKCLAGLSLEIPHARSRFDERGVPLQYLITFQPECWKVITVETAVRTGRITYMSLRREIESTQYLWIVLAGEHVIVTDSRSDRATNPLIVKDGPAWEAAAEGQEPAITGALAEWGDGYARRVRALRVLDAVAALPERPSAERLSRAARLVLRGRTWNEAAAEAGWASRAGLDAAIVRLLRAVKRDGGRAGDGH